MRRAAIALVVAAAATACTASPAPGSVRPQSEAAVAVTAVGANLAAGPLGGYVIVLDPGHDGGNAADPAFINRPVPNGIGGTKACDTVGTETAGGYPEHAFTFDVVKRAAALMRKDGAHVVLTRTNDTGRGPCVDMRAKIGNRAYGGAAVLAISVHADGGPVGGRGFHVIEPAFHSGSPVDRVLKPSDRLAHDLIRAVVNDTRTGVSTYVGGGKGLTARIDLAGLMLSRVPKVYIEAANMRNPADAALCRSAAFRQKLAQALTDAAIRFVHGH
ncbi:MAG TPA: N-acetylmuramoyl-L-alanine amidase [Mycobacteriales bacterium]|nr:N-acetylmuramoyl-L-alanine amidase [Mycobacteriales bacterium]